MGTSRKWTASIALKYDPTSYLFILLLLFIYFIVVIYLFYCYYLFILLLLFIYLLSKKENALMVEFKIN